MKVYRLFEDRGRIVSVGWSDAGTDYSAPLKQDNSACIQFLINWKAGAEVLNADGSPAPYSDDAVRALGLEPV